MIIYNAGVCLKIGCEALRAKIYTRFQFYIYFFKILYKVTLLIYIVTCLIGFAIRFFIIAAFIIVAAFIFRNPFGMSWDCYMRTQF